MKFSIFNVEKILYILHGQVFVMCLIQLYIGTNCTLRIDVRTISQCHPSEEYLALHANSPSGPE